MPSDFAGNSISRARNLNALSGTRTFSDFVGAADTDDYYRFTLPGRRDFSLLLNGMSADADVRLLNSAGGFITSSARGGNSPDSITRTLDAGTYFVRVYRYGSSNTNYNLRLAVAPTPPDFAGNSTSGARNLNALSGTRTFSDFVGAVDPNDYYRFTLAGRRDFSLVLNGLTADAEVQLLNSTGGLITSSSNGGSTAERITRTLDAGTYFVRVYPYNNNNTNYNLSLTANSISPPPGIDTRTATPVRDVLTGTLQQRSDFAFANLSYSLPEFYDQITNYESVDRIKFLNRFYNTTITSALQVNDFSGLIQLGNVAQQLAPNAATAFRISQSLISQVISQLLPSGVSPQVVQSLIPPTPGTFVAVNDGVQGFNPQTDSIIFLRNYFPSQSSPVSIL